MFCKKCGGEIEEGAAFCQKCGTPIEPPKLFCPGCGQEIKDSAQFCPKCGTKVKNGFNINTGDIVNKIGQASEKGMQVATKLAKDAKSGSEEIIEKIKNSDNPSLQAIKETVARKAINPLLIILAIISIIEIILWFVNSLYGEAAQYGISETLSMHDACQDAKIISVITIILLIISACLCVVCGCIKPFKGINIIGLIVQIWYLGWILIERIGTQYLLEDSGYSGDIEIGFLGAGKFMLLLSFVSIAIYVYKIALKKKAEVS